MIIRPTTAIINLGAISHNFRILKKRIKPRVRVMAVVKADAYGNGAVPIARTLARDGADWFGVALAEEGIELRRAGIEQPVLVMGIVPPLGAEVVANNRLDAALCGLENALALNQAAEAAGCKAAVHLKIDTGMSRIGLTPADALPFVERLLQLRRLDIRGVFSHFASADEVDQASTSRQLERFRQILGALHDKGIDIPLKHFANSAAALGLPRSHFDMVRPGVALYGIDPCANSDRPAELRQSMTLKTRIVMLKRVAAGESISYGGTYISSREILAAVLPVGYADGYPRLMSNQGDVLVHGRRAPVVGRVCMDMTMIDVSHIPGVRLGDEAVLFGCQDGESITIHEVAAKAKTICHEIMCGVSRRAPKLYE